ncbi:component of the polarisome [Boothiomyces macroporosus]|uniref:Component of the polarisome n=1 Tax=Boothiomyces macroporosus TaxID=261099 RepID=A0AAD5Y6D6_9FUNG|nr:component of the polarisome [Boothiomyces macroporosus]
MNLQEQYQLFKKYSKKSPNRSEKLSQLSHIQFVDFSQDLYDELNRRNDKECMDPFLQIDESFHQVRNQARQKLATLSEERFEDLIDDFCVEHEFRVLDQLEMEFPEINAESTKDDSTDKHVMIPGRFQSLYKPDISQELQEFKTLYQIKEQAYKVINQETHDLRLEYQQLRKEFQEMKLDNEKLKNENKEINLVLSKLVEQVDKQQKDLTELARDHYKLFTSVLEQDLPHMRMEAQNGRENFTTLTIYQFLELSTDVYDELQRRLRKDCTFSTMFLLNRNQARKKLSELDFERYKEFVGDVFFEIERRFPELVPPHDPSIPPKVSYLPILDKNCSQEAEYFPHAEQDIEIVEKQTDKPENVDRIIELLGELDLMKTKLSIKEQEIKDLLEHQKSYSDVENLYRKLEVEHEQVEYLKRENKEMNFQIKELKLALQKQQKELSELARLHYRLFTDFLRVDLPQLRNQSGNTRSSAREKLTRLSKNQFSELSTDVYDELNRRLKENSGPFLSVNELYHPKRNQARQKLASLQVGRFKELVSDVFFEIERRFPQLLDQQYQYQQYPQQFQQYPPPQPYPYGQVPQQALPPIPDRKTSLEPLPVNFASLDSLMADLGGMMSTDKKEIQPPIKINNDTGNGDQVQQLLGQLEEMKGRYADKEKEVQELLEKQKKFTDLEQQYRKLDDEHEQLKLELSALQEDAEEQQQITNAIRGEATNLLGEIKQLSLENQSLKNSNKQLGDDLVSLTKENAQLRETNQKNAQRIAELSQINRELESRVANQPLTSNPIPKKEPTSYPSLSRRENPNIDFQNEIPSNGYFDKKKLEPYTLAVNQLLSEAQSKQANTNILVAMKQIVLACKAITEDCDRFESEKRLSKQEKLQLTQIKSKLSSYLTNQMLIAKAAATEAPKDDFYVNIETATSDLTSVVVDLVRTINSYDERPPSPTRPQSPTKFEAPASPLANGKSIDGSLDKGELKTTPVDSEFRQTIEGISKIVATLINESSATIRGAPSDLQTQGEIVLDKLKGANQSLVEYSDQMAVSPGSKQIKQQIASSSYEIAKVIIS